MLGPRESTLLLTCYVGAMQELQMWKTLSHHKNLVRFYGSCEQDGKVSLVLEYMEVCPPFLPTLLW